MEILTTRSFNGVQLDCYKSDNAEDDFWATREQIGRLLGYSEPMKAIAKIHERHKENLDRYSSVDKLTTEAGERETVIYNFKGFLEICRYSNQPKAEAVISFCWNVMDEIRRTGSYNSKIEAGKMLLRVLEESKYPLSERERKKILSEALYLVSGVKLKEDFYSCKDIAKELHITEKRVLKKALSVGIMKPNDNVYGFWDKNYEWFFNEFGREKILEQFESLNYWCLK